ncbi:MAG: TM0996/MTH895 family glutaredoxin-like protein [Candidatus Hydrogenedentes bacterium]|nr:TM0996/MTH895 family glutaredoxin-like protein [Candidatus Hydrogenedentota bacterium]
MKKLQILGTGCPSCNRLAELTKQAATEMNVEFEMEKVTQIDRILSFDVASTPALVVDGEVKIVGRVPSVAELKQII